MALEAIRQRGRRPEVTKSIRSRRYRASPAVARCCCRRMCLEALLSQPLGSLPDSLLDPRKRLITRQCVIEKNQIEIDRQARHVSHEQVDRRAAPSARTCRPPKRAVPPVSTGGRCRERSGSQHELTDVQGSVPRWRVLNSAHEPDVVQLLIDPSLKIRCLPDVQRKNGLPVNAGEDIHPGARREAFQLWNLEDQTVSLTVCKIKGPNPSYFKIQSAPSSIGRLARMHAMHHGNNRGAASDGAGRVDTGPGRRRRIAESWFVTECAAWAQRRGDDCDDCGPLFAERERPPNRGSSPGMERATWRSSMPTGSTTTTASSGSASIGCCSTMSDAGWRTSVPVAHKMPMPPSPPFGSAAPMTAMRAEGVR